MDVYKINGQIAEIEKKEKKEKELMDSIAGIGAKIDASVQSISALVEEVNEDTKGVTTAMTDVAQGKGSLVIDFKDEAEFDRIMELFNKK